MRREGIEVAVATTVGGIISLVIWALMQTDAGDRTPTGDAAPTVDEAISPIDSELNVVSTLPLREQADIEPFLEAFVRSRMGTYQVTGRIEVAQPGNDAATTLPVTRIRRERDAIEEVGSTLVVALDGKQQTCERLFGSELSCGDVTEPTIPALEALAVRQLFDGPDPDYLLYADDPGCWQLVATATADPAEWGQSTTICFDAETGAISRQITSGAQGSRAFVAEEISAEVSDADLVPPTS